MKKRIALALAVVMTIAMSVTAAASCAPSPVAEKNDAKPAKVEVVKAAVVNPVIDVVFAGVDANAVTKEGIPTVSAAAAAISSVACTTPGVTDLSVSLASPVVINSAMQAAQAISPAAAPLMVLNLGAAMPAAGADVALGVPGVMAGDTVVALAFVNNAWVKIPATVLGDGAVSVHITVSGPVAIVKVPAGTATAPRT